MSFYAVFCFGLWFIFFNGIPFFSYPTMLMCNHEITEMIVEDVENPKNLPIYFSNSIRSDQSLAYYQFDFNAAQPLELQKIVIYNAKKNMTFQKFRQKNNRVLIDEEDGDFVWLNGKASIILRNSLPYQEFKKEEFLTLKLIADQKIFVQYKFAQGIITVQYRFIDTETHYGRSNYFLK